MTYNLDWLKEKFDQGNPIKYIFFWGQSHDSRLDIGPFVFSQWYPSKFSIDGIEYKSAEHWMMAQKALLFGNHDIFQQIISEEKPAAVKALGRQITGFDQNTWDANKFNLVVRGNAEKFKQDEQLKNYLVSTGDRVIVEASPVDNIWGIGLAKDHRGIKNPHNWKGQNLLGFAIMEARDVIKTL